MNTKNKMSGYIIRSTAYVTLLSSAVVGFTWGFNLRGGSLGQSRPVLSDGMVQPASRTITFADRVVYQRAIEEVYWRHRIWPKGNPGQKPALDAVISRAQIEQKVADYLRKSQFVADQREQAITPAQLQAEMDRMARDTKQPNVLHEIFAALGNDPFVIAECLARPA